MPDVFALSSLVVYDGCPKAFDAGIWWPKTKFGRPAATHCPKGSVGRYHTHTQTHTYKHNFRVLVGLFWKEREKESKNRRVK